nr:hypothetical protein [Leuconostoc citreum]
MALNAAILKNTMSGDDLVSAVLHEATTAVKQFELIEADEDEDEI